MANASGHVIALGQHGFVDPVSRHCQVRKPGLVAAHCLVGGEARPVVVQQIGPDSFERDLTAAGLDRLRGGIFRVVWGGGSHPRVRSLNEVAFPGRS